MKQVIILDASSGRVVITTLPAAGILEDAVENFCDAHNLRFKDCDWMEFSGQLEIGIPITIAAIGK